MSKIFFTKCSQFAGVHNGITFPLGVMSLASVLRRESDSHEFEIFDLRTNFQDYAALKEAATKFKPDIVGLSAITMESPSLFRAARSIRETGFDGPIIAGGPQPTAFPEETLECQDIDYLAIGEAEETFKEFVQVSESGGDLKKVPGLAFRENGQVRLSPTRPYITDLDALPFPAWDLVDIDTYAQYHSMSALRCGTYMNLFTSRACPYRCSYCHNIFGKGFRARSPESVLQEAKLLVDRYDIRYFEIVDDIFNCDSKRAKKIFDLMYYEGLPVDITFPSGLRCDIIDREFLEKLARFNFSLICVAVETVTPRIQKMIRKNLNIGKVKKMIEDCAELGVYTRGYFMLGFPTETADEIKATVDFAVKSKLHSAYFFAVTPFKGTELYDMCQDKVKDSTYHLEDHDFFRSNINLSEASDKELFGQQKWAYFRLFSSPSRIYRLLRDFPDYRFVWLGLRAWKQYFLGAGVGYRKGRPSYIPQRSKFWTRLS